MSLEPGLVTCSDKYGVSPTTCEVVDSCLGVLWRDGFMSLSNHEVI